MTWYVSESSGLIWHYLSCNPFGYAKVRYNTYSPVENQNDWNLILKFFSLLILVVQTLYLVNPTDATLASLSVWK